MRYFSTFSGIGGFELGIQLAWKELAPNAEKQELSIKGSDHAKNALLNMQENGEQKTRIDTMSGFGERTSGTEEKYSMPTAGNARVAVKQRRNSLPLTTKTMTAQNREESSGEVESTIKSSNKTFPTHFKSSVTTAISQKDSMDNVPTCVGFSEIDKYAIQIYKKHFPNHEPFGDITKIDERGLPDFDLLCGGFPCQSFSIAGKRGGFEDTRGTLFFDIARIAAHKRPRLLFLENVKGLLSHDAGRTFNTIIATLDELGYDLQWQVLNSKNHGVPQNRERVFIIGHLRGTPRPQVFPIGYSDSKDNATSKQGDYTRTITTAHAHGSSTNMSYIANTPDTSTQETQGRYNIVQLNNPTHSNERVYGESGISPALNTMQGGNRQPKIVASRGREDGQNLESRKDGLSNPLTSVEKDNWLDLGTRIRRLTPTECERLQGFPDNWTVGISDSQRYKCLGNAVTVNVIKDIAERLLV